MLVLSRKQDESLVIDGRIEVVVVRTTPDKVRLGIIAHRNVPIVRKELIDHETLAVIEAEQRYWKEQRK